MPRTLATLSSGKRVLGFTLVEVLMVAAAILILVAIGVPNFVSALKRAKVASAKVQLLSYKAALEQYHTDTRRYPPSGSEFFYYALSGLAPFNRQTSTRYKPPYHDFDLSLIGKPSDGSDYDTEYDGNPIYQFPNDTSDSEAKAKVNMSRLRPSGSLRWAGGQIEFHPVIDPWGRPVVYIAPEDLKAWWNRRPTEWEGLIGVSDETAFYNGSEWNYVPFDMHLGQFWSAGPDASTADQTETSFGLFQPGNLLVNDGRDNDNDTSTDVSDNEVKRQRDGAINQIPEDDISSWGG